MASIRRADRPGDLGWIVMAHGEVYHRQFGWDTSFEHLVARVVADYDPRAGAAWIAETATGERAGCVMLVAAGEPYVAKLRVLLVTESARGLGLGGQLVAECLAHARQAGYRRVDLWTVDECTSARRIYEAHGFTLRSESPHPGFGHPLTGQDWSLDVA
ncbi:GNAT family N-acetyltransferase [Actinoplanes sp. CA-054009]